VKANELNASETMLTSNLDCSVVIVNYNSGHWLTECLRALYAHAKHIAFDVLVVDNASYDESLLRACRHFPEIEIIKNEKNVGFAAACNQGIRASQSRYVLLLNPDALLLNDKLVDWFRYMDEHPEVGISGPKVFDDESKQSVQLSCRGFPSYLNTLFSRYSPLTRLFPQNRYSRQFLMTDFDHTHIRSVDWVSGCCMLLRREMIEQIGFLDEVFRFFFDDVDICQRAHRAGWQVLYHPTSLEIAHYVGSIKAQVPLKMIVQRHRSLWHYYKKFHRNTWLFRLLFGMGIFSRMVFLLSLALFRKIAPILYDLSLIQVGILLSYLARGVWDFPWFERAVGSYVQISFWFTLMQLALLYVFDLYASARARYTDYFDILPRVVKAVSTGTLMLVFIAFFAREFFLPRSIVLFSWFFNIVLLAGWRWLLIYFEHKRTRPQRVLIYGTGMLASLVEEELRRRVALKHDVIGFIQPAEGAVLSTLDPILGRTADLSSLMHEHRIDRVLVALEEPTEQEIVEVQRQVDWTRLDTRLASDLYELSTETIHLDYLQGPLLEPSKLPARGRYLFLKRLIDLIVSFVLLLAASPLMALVALAIRSSSPGPIFFRQPRAGLAGRPFMLYKFRTMRERTSNETDPEDDLARMTPLGKFLRLTRLDELPQFLNVLRGDMSLVGPRAEWTKRAEEMARQIASFEQRHLVRPGMTGWAQVEYRYTTSVAEYRKKVQYDLYYIKNMSLVLDFKILLKTIWVVLTAKGAR
jgi:exopolysaccharide biosynthesis polyprenyl glycosylphosphotransferase